MPRECLGSYDVPVLFTSVSVDPALGIIKDLLEKDSTLKERTVLPVLDIILLLEFCLKSTHFPSKDKWTSRGCGYGIPSRPHSSHPLHGVLQAKGSKYCHPPHPIIWLRYVDDTSVVQREENKQNFLELINSVNPAIIFTVEDSEDGAIPFLDITVKPEADGKLFITVYRKPTNMDQYLQWDSHHHLSAKYSVINTPTHRAKTVCNKAELLQKEMEHLRKALTQCKYPKWALDKVEKRITKPPSEVSNVADSQVTTGAQPTIDEVKTKGHIVVMGVRGRYPHGRCYLLLLRAASPLLARRAIWIHSEVCSWSEHNPSSCGDCCIVGKPNKRYLNL